MSELIDRDALLKEVENEQKYLIARGQLSEEHILVHALKRPVLDAPTVSVGTKVQEAFMDGYRYRDAEIVRCYECKHNPKKKLVGCPMADLNERQRPEDAWCWKGER